jgi:hypothetical protein
MQLRALGRGEGRGLIRGDPLPPIGWSLDSHAGVEFVGQYMAWGDEPTSDIVRLFIAGCPTQEMITFTSTAALPGGLCER